jgi:predicted lipoprotein with Yx(FWY)xxD motif
MGAILAGCGSQAATSPTPTPSPTPVPVVNVRDDATLGKLLVAANGMTLYKFANDTAGVSNCKDACLTRWPPLTAPSGQKLAAGAGVTGTLAVIASTGGSSSQVTYNGLPLYFFQGDTNPGDTKGATIAKWSVVKP